MKKAFSILVLLLITTLSYASPSVDVVNLDKNLSIEKITSTDLEINVSVKDLFVISAEKELKLDFLVFEKKNKNLFLYSDLYEYLGADSYILNSNRLKNINCKWNTITKHKPTKRMPNMYHRESEPIFIY